MVNKCLYTQNPTHQDTKAGRIGGLGPSSGGGFERRVGQRLYLRWVKSVVAF
jgi:hypothetical protein